MKKVTSLLLIISILEGGALMATELIGAKLLAPYFGTTIYVWASIFTVTLLGLATGYALGGYFSKKSNLFSYLRKALLFGVIFILLIPLVGQLIMGSLLNLPFILGVTLSSLFLLTPALICFGMVSPLIIQLLNNEANYPGKNASKVYTLSTLGGVISTFYFGFYLIPFTGISISLIIISVMTCLGFLISLSIKSSFNVK